MKDPAIGKRCTFIKNTGTANLGETGVIVEATDTHYYVRRDKTKRQTKSLKFCVHAQKAHVLVEL